MFILSQSQVLPTLLQFIDIEDIPQKYGGRLAFESGDMPNLDPAIRECMSIGPEADAETYLLTAPVRWIDDGSDGEMKAISVGSMGGERRQQQVAVLHPEMTRIATHASRMSRTDPPPAPVTNGAVPTAAMAQVSISAPQEPVIVSASDGADLKKEPTEFVTPPSSPSEIPLHI